MKLHSKKKDGSRKLVFEHLEKNLLRPLPCMPFELSQWEYNHKAGYDCHVSFQTNKYSVPFQHIGKSVDIKYNSTVVEVYSKGERISSHPRFPQYVRYKYSTNPTHMPDNLTKTQWNTNRIEEWATKIGPKTYEVIDRILNSVKIKEQAYNAALAVLKLSKTYSPLRLENACEFAADRFNVPRYQHINAILKKNQDTNEKNSSNSLNNGGYIRGAKYYGGKSNE